MSKEIYYCPDCEHSVKVLKSSAEDCPQCGCPAEDFEKEWGFLRFYEFSNEGEE
jgi:rubrerythrin|tara:strand:+ start:13 stop:174 length:162 start_codon:yes stop_codon:yes gene_type:complete